MAGLVAVAATTVSPPAAVLALAGLALLVVGVRRGSNRAHKFGTAGLFAGVLRAGAAGHRRPPARRLGGAVLAWGRGRKRDQSQSTAGCACADTPGHLSSTSRRRERWRASSAPHSSSTTRARRPAHDCRRCCWSRRCCSSGCSTTGRRRRSAGDAVEHLVDDVGLVHVLDAGLRGQHDTVGQHRLRDGLHVVGRDERATLDDRSGTDGLEEALGPARETPTSTLRWVRVARATFPMYRRTSSPTVTSLEVTHVVDLLRSQHCLDGGLCSVRPRRRWSSSNSPFLRIADGGLREEAVDLSLGEFEGPSISTGFCVAMTKKGWGLRTCRRRR